MTVLSRLGLHALVFSTFSIDLWVVFLCDPLAYCLLLNSGLWCTYTHELSYAAVALEPSKLRRHGGQKLFVDLQLLLP